MRGYHRYGVRVFFGKRQHHNKNNEDILDWLMKNNIKMNENEIEPYMTN